MRSYLPAQSPLQSLGIVDNCIRHQIICYKVCMLSSMIKELVLSPNQDELFRMIVKIKEVTYE